MVVGVCTRTCHYVCRIAPARDAAKRLCLGEACFFLGERGVTTLGWGLEAKPGTGVPPPAPVLHAPDPTTALQPEGRVPVPIELTGPLLMCCEHKPRLYRRHK